MLSFDAQTVEMPEINQRLVGKWLTAVAGAHDRLIGNLSYRFCSDEEILAANRQFLGHDYFTDIITFDYTLGKKIGGDMLISLDTVKSNAEGMGLPYDRELLRVIVHGVLHLCGIDDKGPGEREIMERAENDALALYDEMK